MSLAGERWSVRSLIVAFVLLAGAFFTTVAIIPMGARATVLDVGGGGPGNFTTISEAVNASHNGDTIFVYSGTYEDALGISKSISLIGEDESKTFLDCKSAYVAIYIASTSSVKVSGFTIMGENYSVGIYDSRGVTATHNVMSGGGVQVTSGYVYTPELWESSDLVPSAVPAHTARDSFVLVPGNRVVHDQVAAGLASQVDGTGWTLRTAGADGKIVYRLWGGKSPLFGKAWSAAKMDTKGMAEAAFGKLTTGNTADRLAVGLVKPGMPYWSHIGVTGIEELWIATPEQSILLFAENML